MANEAGIITDFIDLSATGTQAEAFLATLKRIDDAYNSLSSKSISLTGLSNTKEITAQIKELQAELARLQSAKQQILDTDLKAQKVATEEARTRQQTAKAISEEAKAEAATAAAKGKTAAASTASQRASKAEQKAVDDLANDYKQLSLAYNEAALRAKNLQLVQGGSSAATKAAIAEANALGAKLKEVDASVGQYQRNVGDYSNKFVEGFTKAFGFLRQAAAIIPGLGLSGIFLLAFDAISSVVQSLGFFSNALEKAAQDQLFLNEVTSKAIDLQKEYEDATQRNYGTINRAAQNELVYAKARGDSAEKILEIEKKIAQQRLASASGDFFGTGGEDQLDKIRDKLISAENALTSFYQAGKSPGLKESFIPGLSEPTFNQEKYNTRETQLKAEFELAKKQFEKQRGITEEYYNANRDLAEKDLELKKLQGEQLKNFYSKESNELALYYIGLEDALSKAVELGAQARIAVRTREFEDQKALDVKAYNEKIRDANESLRQVLTKPGVSNKEKVEAERKYVADIATIENEFRTGQKVDELKFQDDLQAIRGAAEQKRRDDLKRDNDLAEALFKEQADARIKARQKLVSDNANKRDIAHDDELITLEKLHSLGLISEEKYQKQRYDIERKYELRSLADLIDNAKYLIDHAKENGTTVLEQERIIADARRKLSDQLTNDLIANEDRLRDERKKLVSQVTAGIGEVAGDFFDKEKNQIQGQIDLLNKKKQAEIDAVNNSVASEQDKAAQIAIINARADAQQQQLEKRQKDQDVKKAEFDKIIAEIQIAANTAQTIQSLTLKAAEARAQGALLAANPLTASYAGIAYASAASIAAQIPIAIAQGIIAAALVAARPIPRYKTGIGNDLSGTHPGGPFIAGDGGRPEFVLLPNGEGFVTAAHDTLYSGPKGTRVFLMPIIYLKNFSKCPCGQ
jgi:hypothetical protein